MVNSSNELLSFCLKLIHVFSDGYVSASELINLMSLASNLEQINVITCDEKKLLEKALTNLSI